MSADEDVQQLLRELRVHHYDDPAKREQLRQLCARTGFCEYCGAPEATKQGAMTMYARDPKHPDRDPNPDLTLCEKCSQEYEDHWNEAWDAYYMGIGYPSEQRDASVE